MAKTVGIEEVRAGFERVFPGDRVRITEEFVVKEASGNVLYYEAADPSALPDGASGWEYWPTEHVTDVTITRMAGN